MSNIDKVKAASLIEQQVLSSLKIQLKSFELHPIRLIQASKSLIGLNLDFPNQILLDFNSNHIKEFDNKSNYSNSKYNEKLNTVISIYDLESAFLNKDRKSILDMLYQLSLVSGQFHILEYLIEISLKQSGKSFLMIWSLYRSILFISNKNSQLFLNLSADIILSDEFEDILDTKINWNSDIIKCSSLSMDFIDLYSHLLEAYNTDLVRGLKIKNLILSLISRKSKYKSDNFSINNTIQYIELFNNGRSWLLEFLNKTDKQNITTNLILFLDSIRCLFRFSDKSDYKFICLQFEKFLEEFDV